MGQRALGLRWDRGAAAAGGAGISGQSQGAREEDWESVREAGGQQAGARGQEQSLPGVTGSAGVAALVERSVWGELRGLALAPCPPCPGPTQSYCAGPEGGKNPPTLPGPHQPGSWPFPRPACPPSLCVCNEPRPPAGAGQGAGAGAELGSHLVRPHYGATSPALSMGLGMEEAAGPQEV